MQHYDSDEIINVGVGDDISIKALATMTQEVIGFNGDVVWDSSKPDGTPRKLMDVSKISKLGWKSRIGLEDGIRLVYQHYIDAL